MRAALLVVALVIPALCQEPPCLPRVSQSCVPCHGGDAQPRFAARASRPCSAYCTSCHFKEDPKAHHPVGLELRRAAGLPPLQLTGSRLTCATCHDVARPRTDTRRWKAASFFDSTFRRQSRYPTYFLVVPNDQGQLCKACH